MSSKQERQSEVLEHLQEDETSVRIFLTNGFRMYGTVIGHDQYCVYQIQTERKKWYTNIFPTNFNNSSAMTAKMTPSSKNGWKTYDFLVSHTNAWGWTKYKYTGDEVIALRGHTIELGCTLMEFSSMIEEEDGFILYFSGHGCNGDLCFSDGMINIQSIIDFVEKLKIKK